MPLINYSEHPTQIKIPDECYSIHLEYCQKCGQYCAINFGNLDEKDFEHLVEKYGWAKFLYDEDSGYSYCSNCLIPYETDMRYGELITKMVNKDDYFHKKSYKRGVKKIMKNEKKQGGGYANA